MDAVRKVAERLRELMSPDEPSGQESQAQSAFVNLQLPHTFGPNLGALRAFCAVCGSLARIFGTCFWLALWGGASAWIWNALGSRFWRVATVVPLVLLFLAGLAGVMIAIAWLQRRMNSVCRRLKRG